MNFIRRLLGRDTLNGIEEPLFPAPKGGEEIQFDEEERAAIAEALQEESRHNTVFEQALTDRGLNPRDYDLSSSDQGAYWSACRQGLKKLAYIRYTNMRYASAAETCIKALALSDTYKSMYRHQGVAEAWLMLAHMHACTGRFKIAKDLIKSAKKAAKDDPLLIGDMRTLWDRAVRSLETEARVEKHPHPVTTIFFVPGEDQPIMPRLPRFPST